MTRSRSYQIARETSGDHALAGNVSRPYKERREYLNGDQIGSTPKSPSKQLMILAKEKRCYVEKLGGERWSIFRIDQGKRFHSRNTLAKNFDTQAAFDFLRSVRDDA